LEKLGLDPVFWQGKRVFLTGHTGFKGSWLALMLEQLGALVSGYSLAPPTEPNLFEQAHVSLALVRSEQADIRDFKTLNAALQAAQPEIVFHLAAQPLVKTAFADPLDTFSSNIMGTAHVLEAIRLTPGIQAGVIITSDKAYLPHVNKPHRESDPLGGHEPYAASKACAEIITLAYRETYTRSAKAPQIATARAGNVLGGGDWSPHRLLPDLVQAFSAGKQIPLRYPEAVRPWQYVLDPLCGYLLLAQAMCLQGSEFASAWNFGPDSDASCTVGELSSLSARLWGCGTHWVPEPGEHPAETAFLRLNSDQARQKLHWQPQLNLEETLVWTLNWYKAWYARQDMARYTRSQLAEYLQNYALLERSQ